MKHSLKLLALGIVAAFSSFTASAADVVKSVSVPSFKKITVNGNIDVALSEGGSSMAVIQGDAILAEAVTFVVSNDELIITANPKLKFKGKLMVTVSVNKLQAIRVNGASEIVSINPLQSEKLQVQINADCKVRLQSTGKIAIEAMEGYEFDYLFKRPADKVIIIQDESY